MDSSDSSRELLDNVSISDVGNSQYMIQRMSVDNSQLLNAELPLHHSGLVVDLGAGDFIPVNYPSEDLLGQDLTEEDRNLAAALVAVQLSQQQKQQQIHQDSNIINTSLPSLVTNSTLGEVESLLKNVLLRGTTPILDSKALNDQQLILSDKSANGNYLHIVGVDNIYENFGRPSDIKCEEENDFSREPKDSDVENQSDNRSSKQNLPHKKRIPRKLKKPSPVSRKLFKCNLCEETFTTNDAFSQHQSLCQTTITPINSSLFNCQLCNKSFQDQLQFFEHLKSHYEPSNQPQAPVGIDEDEKSVLKLEDETPKDSLLSSLLNLQCIQCNRSFRRQKAYESHIRETHTKVDLNEFSEPEDLMAGIDVVVDNHVQNSDDDDNKNWSKYRDDELHATEEDLLEIEAQEHVCHICKQPFPIRAILLQHLTNCRNEQTAEVANNLLKKKGRKKNGELSCTECDRVFTHRNSLVYHMRSHTGDRPHQCEQCGKSFFAASALKVHMRLHSGDKPYKCIDCGRQFRQWGDLKYHCISIHSDQKQYQCEYCGKDFARKYSLIVHRRIHTGEKNYKCEFCGKTFRASSYLQNHRRIHTGEKPHSCDICGKPFRVRSDMKRHLKTHGRARPVHCDVIVAKIEESEASENNVLLDSDETQAQEAENDAAVQTLQYDQGPLVDNMHDGNTLYTNGHQFIVLYPGEVPLRTIEASSTWTQTT